MVDMKELKNCPFCGGHALIINCQTGMSTRGSYVACKKCNSEGATFNSYNGNHEELAAIAWNTRAVDTQIESLTAQLNARNDDMAFIKRWVQRVYDKETSLEEFYGVLRYYEPLKPINPLTPIDMLAEEIT